MKATGIVRRIDDLGRIVIPKEIRKTLRINEGSPLEIFTDSSGNVIFKKYSPVREIADIAKIYTDAISLSFSCACIIMDTDRVVAVSGVNKKEFDNKNISEEFKEFMTINKKIKIDEKIKIVETSNKESELSVLIISQGDIIGAISLFNIEKIENLKEQRILEVFANLIVKQIE